LANPALIPRLLLFFVQSQDPMGIQHVCFWNKYFPDAIT